MDLKDFPKSAPGQLIRTGQGYWAFFLVGVRDQEEEAALRVQTLQELRENYRRPLAGQRSAKRLAGVVDFMIGNPILSVRGLQTGMGLADFKTAQRYVDAIEKVGILREITGRMRSRLYQASAVFEAIQKPLGSWR